MVLLLPRQISVQHACKHLAAVGHSLCLGAQGTWCRQYGPLNAQGAPCGGILMTG